MQLYTKINSGSNKTASNDDIHKKVAVQYEQLSKGIVSLIIASNTDLIPFPQKIENSLHTLLEMYLKNINLPSKWDGGWKLLMLTHCKYFKRCF